MVLKLDYVEESLEKLFNNTNPQALHMEILFFRSLGPGTLIPV